MALLIMCNNSECGDFFEVPDDSAGKEVRCPNCDATQIAPQKTDKAEKSAEKEKKTTPPPETIALADEQVETSGASKPSEPAKSIRTPPSKSLHQIVLEDDDENKKNSIGEKLFIAEEGKAAPSDDEDLPSLPADESEELETLFAEDDLPVPDSLQKQVTDGEGMISAERVSAFIFLTGYALMALGLLTGAWLGWGGLASVVMGIYIGGSGGWLGGFLVAFVIIAGQQKDTSETQCPACGHVSRDQGICGHCGLPLTTRNLHPLTAGCLAAGRFARDNKTITLRFIIPTIGAYLVYAVPTHHFKLFNDPWNANQYIMCGAITLVIFLVYCNWLGLLIAAVDASRVKKSIIKKAPWFWQKDCIVAGFRGLGVLIIYVLPLVTLPLLPLGLLAVSSRGKIKLGDLKYHFKFAKANTQEIALLWLFMLMWCSGLFLSCMIVEGINQVTTYIPYHNRSDILIARGIFQIILLATVLGTFSLAIFRCLGEFGRSYHYGGRKT